MIFPGDFRSFATRPSLRVSWVVLFLNVAVYLMTLAFFSPWPSKEIWTYLQNEDFKRSVSEMYVQTLDPVEKKHVPSDTSKLYAVALKDQKFWSRVADFPFTGDQLQIAENRRVITDFYQGYLKSPQHLFGLSSFDVSAWAWLTYQFVHASWIHLLGNVLLLFLIMSYLERQVSDSWLVATYILSGFAGGALFLMVDTVGSMAVVGSSASASGLMGFLLLTRGHKLMPWGYVIAPVKNGYGQIFLPVFFIFPVFLMSDFMAMLWEPTGIAANIAVSAHVGGCLMGFAIGGVYLFFRSKAASHRIFRHHDGLHELP